jgi:peptide-methionine (S)-S-oxide reductase
MFLIDRLKFKMQVPDKANALPGRNAPLETAQNHFVSGRDLHGDYPQNAQILYLGLGCFWGAERKFWQLPAWVTAVGYMGGLTPNPTYNEVCTGLTGHNEVVKLVYVEDDLPLSRILKTFWEIHDPTQGMRQGNDVGTQYRSGIYCTNDLQMAQAEQSKQEYQAALIAGGKSSITTEIMMAPEFYYAEEYHQQYLAKNPEGYCGLKGTGVSCPI